MINLSVSPAEFFFSGSLKWRFIIFTHVSTIYMLHHNSPIHGRKGESERVRVYMPIAKVLFCLQTRAASMKVVKSRKKGGKKSHEKEKGKREREKNMK